MTSLHNAHLMRPGIEFDAGRHHRAKLGFVLLSMEQTIESDMMRLAPEGVGVHFTRATMPNQVTAANLAEMIGDMSTAAALLAPEAGLDVLCYACTSGSVVMGEDNVRSELAKGNPKTIPTTLVSGVFAALEVLNTKRVVVATPYLDEVNAIEADYMTDLGYDVLDIVGLNITDDADMVRVTPDYIRDFAISVDRPDAEAIFVSCGALRTIDVIDEIEAATGKPVVASNQAMMWHCLRLAGVDDHLDGYGRLFREF
ncbi:MAG: arylmalonate decarboxylase [Acidimicrobiia bacterium]|nr:arylmalonate decarboxylase [Acidimicrobiia bacterium]